MSTKFIFKPKEDMTTYEVACVIPLFTIYISYSDEFSENYIKALKLERYFEKQEKEEETFRWPWSKR